MSDTENPKGLASSAKEANSILLQKIVQTVLLTIISAIIMGFFGYLGWLGTTLVSISNKQETILHELEMRKEEKAKMISVLTEEIHKTYRPISEAPPSLKSAYKSEDEGYDFDGDEEVKKQLSDTEDKKNMEVEKDMEVEKYQRMIQQKISIPRPPLQYKK